MEEMSPWEDVQCVSSQEPAGSKAKSNPSCHDCRSPCALCSPMRREQRWGGDRGHCVERPVQPQLGPGQLRIFGLRTLFCSNRIWAKWPVGLSSRVLHSSGQSGGKRAQMLQMAEHLGHPFLFFAELKQWLWGKHRHYWRAGDRTVIK